LLLSCSAPLLCPLALLFCPLLALPVMQAGFLFLDVCEFCTVAGLNCLETVIDRKPLLASAFFFLRLPG
jgi:hypothetical protein